MLAPDEQRVGARNADALRRSVSLSRSAKLTCRARVPLIATSLAFSTPVGQP
jgi:hypothetical protein